LFEEDSHEEGIQVMEHREPPRIIAGDHRFKGALEDRGDRFQFPRFPFVRSQRQIHYRRALLVSVATLAVLAAVYLGTQAIRTALDWLSHQPQYQLPFDQIQLIPEPPRWFLGGKPVFLEGVRRNAREPEIISWLEIPSERIRDDFQKFPWVRDVEHVSYGHKTIRIHLRYRQPVAYVQLRPADEKLLDETGTVLNIKDVDVVQLSELSHLIRITGEGLVPPSDLKFGVVWKSRLVGSDHDEPDRRILAASKLAGFLRQPAQLGDAARWPALSMIDINVTNFDPHGLFLKNKEDADIWWREPPGDELPGRPSAEQKWAMLQRWRESNDHRPLPDGDYFAFDSTHVYQKCLHPSSHVIK
jgi:hypothetical protein